MTHTSSMADSKRKLSGQHSSRKFDARNSINGNESARKQTRSMLRADIILLRKFEEFSWINERINQKMEALHGLRRNKATFA